MDFLNDIILNEVFIYSLTFILCFWLIYYYVRRENKKSAAILEKVKLAKEEGRFEPISLHPYIDLDVCMGSGACVRACPEKDILGIVNGKATVINATSCIGHGACFHACPVEAISLRIGTDKRGIDLPHIKPNYETNIPGVFIAGELGGMGLIKNSAEQGISAIDHLAKGKLSSKPDGYLDLLIVGAGPAGIGAALNATKKALSFEILEQDSLGGTVFTFPREKIVMTRPVDLPLYGKLKLHNTSKQELLNLWTKLISDYKIKVVEKTKVTEIIPQEAGGFKVLTSEGDEKFAMNVLLAIGRRGTPRKLNVPGEESAKVAYRLLEPERIFEKKILIVGGGDSAVESALLLMGKNKVTLSYRKEKFARIKARNKDSLQDAISSGNIQLLLNTEVEEIRADTIILQNNANQESIYLENDLIYIFAGGELPTQFLKSVGITIDKKFGKIVKSYRKQVEG